MHGASYPTLLTGGSDVASLSSHISGGPKACLYVGL